MNNSQFAACARCGTIERKTRMWPLYTAVSSSMPPHLMGYLCVNCFADLMDWTGLADLPGEVET